jgi:hypothetical protein
LLSALTSGTVYGITGEPLPFDQFTVSNGQITAGCGNWTNANGDLLNVTCTEPTLSDGMLQRQLTISSTDPDYNGTYVQFILVESGTSGDATAAHFSTDRGNLYFTNEDFIKMNNRGEGIASKQTILDSSFNDSTLIEDRFALESEYKIGWAQGNGGTLNPWLDMSQSLTQLQYDDTMALATSAMELYNDDISVKSVGPGLNNTQVLINQRMYLQDNLNPNDDVAQKFKHSRLSGLYNDLPTDAFGGLVNANPLLPGGTNGGAIDWAVLEEIAATWVGVESINPVAATIDRVFGFTRYENLSHTTGNYLTSLTSFTSPEAGGSLGAWDSIYNLSGLPLFGHAEAMADVTPVTMTDFSVMNPALPLGPASLDYIANSDPAITALPGSLTILDSDYNQWTVTNGEFTVSCPLWADQCAATAINKDGFFQRLITVAGEQYIQTIIVGDAAQTGDPTAADYTANSIGFRTETFVKAGAGNGIASNMHLAERGTNTSYLTAATSVDMPDTAGDFTHDVTMNLGWANRGTVFAARDMDGNGVIDAGEGITEPHAGIAIAQSLLVADNIQTDAVSMEERFTLERGVTQADKRVTMSNRMGTQTGFSDPIEFNSVTVSGAYQRTARMDIIDPFILPGNSSDMTWDAGDALQATWLAAQYGTNPLVPVTQFASTSFTNRTTGERIAYTDLTTLPVNPDYWLIDPFLDEPAYP